MDDDSDDTSETDTVITTPLGCESRARTTRHACRAR